MRAIQHLQKTKGQSKTFWAGQLPGNLRPAKCTLDFKLRLETYLLEADVDSTESSGRSKVLQENG